MSARVIPFPTAAEWHAALDRRIVERDEERERERDADQLLADIEMELRWERADLIDWDHDDRRRR